MSELTGLLCFETQKNSIKIYRNYELVRCTRLLGLHFIEQEDLSKFSYHYDALLSKSTVLNYFCVHISEMSSYGEKLKR